MFYPNFAQPQQFFDIWKKMVEGHITRLEALNEQLATAGELEIGVQLGIRHRSILARSIDNEVTARRQNHRRKAPLRQIPVVIREVVSLQIDRGDIRVVNFNPVAELAVLVLEPVIVDGLKLADQRLGLDVQSGQDEAGKRENSSEEKRAGRSRAGEGSFWRGGHEMGTTMPIVP